MRGRLDRAVVEPDFLPSLQLLVERERYSLTDIGLMFGVSRERVRQWLEKYGLSHPDAAHERGLMCVRIWDDEAMRFRPSLKRVVNSNRRRAQREAKRARRNALQAERRRKVVEATNLLRATLGRDPSLEEMANAVWGRPIPRGQGGAKLAAYCTFGKLSTKKKYREMMAAVSAGTGMSINRPRGGRAHLPKTEKTV